MIWAYVFAVYVICANLPLLNAQWICADIENSATCAGFQNNGLCDKISIFRACQKTCGKCGIPGWSRWSQWSDCSAPGCNLPGRRTRIRQCMTLSKCRGPSAELRPCTWGHCKEKPIQTFCNASEAFLCPGIDDPVEEDCTSRKLICDGYKDCIDNSDETNCKLNGGPTDAFLVALKHEVPMCLYSRDAMEVIVGLHCATTFSPYYEAFRWKWYGQHNLINIEKALCIARTNQTHIGLIKCDSDDINQKWVCDSNGTILLQQASFSHRYMSYGNLTGVLHLAQNPDPNSLWTMYGTDKPLCQSQHVWEEWSQWSQCSTTCAKLGMGKRSRNRLCKGGESGRGLCNADGTQTELCDSPICRPQCPEGFSNTSYRKCLFR